MVLLPDREEAILCEISLTARRKPFASSWMMTSYHAFTSRLNSSE